jgi:hypothetical protein
VAPSPFNRSDLVTNRLAGNKNAVVRLFGTRRHPTHQTILNVTDKSQEMRLSIPYDLQYKKFTTGDSVEQNQVKTNHLSFFAIT